MWRYFTQHHTRRYVERLPRLVKSYNNTFHQSIGMTPNEASKIKNENLVLQRLNPPLPSKPMFKMNDVVRISRYCGSFDIGYLQNWTEDYFHIIKIKNIAPPVYELINLQDELLFRMFYSHELQKILIDPNTTYRIEKVLTKKRGYIFVKFVGWPNKVNMRFPTNAVSQL